MGTWQTLGCAIEEAIAAGETLVRSVGNEEKPESFRMKHGDVESPWVGTCAGGVSPLSLLTFFAAAKKVSAAPHRGNPGEPQTIRGCQRSKNQKPKKTEWRLRRRQKTTPTSTHDASHQ
jgi:hypothetical protein